MDKKDARQPQDTARISGKDGIAEQKYLQIVCASYVFATCILPWL